MIPQRFGLLPEELGWLPVGPMAKTKREAPTLPSHFPCRSPPV